MAHRDDRDALRARRDGIWSELTRRESDDDEAARAVLLRELDDVARSLGAFAAPRATLTRLRVVRGCQVPWSSMAGEGRIRHCGVCDREVYDLTALDADEIDAFLAARREALPCMRLHLRPDGRVQDGPCGAAPGRLLRAAATASVLGLAAALAVLAAGGHEPAACPSRGPSGSPHLRLDGSTIMGEMRVEPRRAPAPAEPEWPRPLRWPAEQGAPPNPLARSTLVDPPFGPWDRQPTTEAAQSTAPSATQ